MQIYISVHELQKLLFKDEMDIILTIYAITDPGTVSSFYGHGKTQTIKVMRQHASELQALPLLGHSGNITDHVLFASVDFISLLYGMKETSH